MAEWPTADDLDSYLDISAGKIRTDVRDLTLAVATEMIAARCNLATSGYSKPTDISPIVRQCILLMASRLYRRQKSPDGILGTTDGFIVRVTRVDPDIESMLLASPLRIPIAGTGTDTRAPVLTLLGDDPMSVDLDSTFTEPGYTAFDAHDGDVTADVVVTGTVDTATAGTYELKYAAADSAGNICVDYREVIVV